MGGAGPGSLLEGQPVSGDTGAIALAERVQEALYLQLRRSRSQLGAANIHPHWLDWGRPGHREVCATLLYRVLP